MREAARVPDAATADGLVDLLEAGDIEVFVRQTSEVGGILGTPGLCFVLEVKDADATKAALLLAGEPEAAEPGEGEEPVAPSTNSLGTWRLASRLGLAGSAIGFVVSVLANQRAPWILGALIVDGLIWHRLSDTTLDDRTGRRPRTLALMRSLAGLGLLLASLIVEPTGLKVGMVAMTAGVCVLWARG